MFLLPIRLSCVFYCLDLFKYIVSPLNKGPLIQHLTHKHYEPLSNIPANLRETDADTNQDCLFWLAELVLRDKSVFLLICVGQKVEQFFLQMLQLVSWSLL